MIDLAESIFGVGRGSLYRVLPFALFMTFIGVEEGGRFLAKHQLLTRPELALHSLYPLKILMVGFLLFRWRGHYDELKVVEPLKPSALFASVVAGVAIFVFWINVPVTLPLVPMSAGFNPGLYPEGWLRTFMVAARITGAVIVVPIMEELFWRSFLLRYLIDPVFEQVPPGQFTWGSFLVTALLFGLEHHLVVAGVIAGAAYSIILYRTRSLALCVLAHSATNLALSIFVLNTGHWHYW